jgi:inner membrane protein COX18
MLEMFLTLTLLVNPCLTMAILVLIGMVIFANIESMKWFISEAQKSRQQEVVRWKVEKRALWDTIIEPKKIVQNVLRIMLVGSILIVVMVPGVCSSFTSTHLANRMPE